MVLGFCLIISNVEFGGSFFILEIVFLVFVCVGVFSLLRKFVWKMEVVFIVILLEVWFFLIFGFMFVICCFLLVVVVLFD